MNVSSIVVQTKTEHLQEVMDTINAYELCEVHFYDSDGKIVATIEGESVGEQMEKLKKIQNIPYVFNANLAYSYCEDELSKVLGEIQGTDDQVPDELKET
jgi:nitrate reductase NapD